MNINILKIPYALFHFVLGVCATYLTWEIVPEILNILSEINLYSDWGDSGVTTAIWFGIMMLAVIYMLGVPVWILFEEEDESP